MRHMGRMSSARQRSLIVGMGLSLGALACALTGTAPIGTPAPAAPPTAAPVAAETREPTAMSPTSAAAEPFRVVGYVTDWDVVVDEIAFEHLTHLNYAFLVPDANGTFVGPEHADVLTAVIAAAHAHDVKVLISVGGWGWDEAFEALASQPPARAHFVADLLAYVDSYDLDGVDLDWEYPGPALGSADSYTHLMTELANGLHARGKLLTAAVVASGDLAEGVQADVFEVVDFLNVMAYDGPDTNHSSLAYAEKALAYWRGRGVPPEKLVLGVPFYSRPQEVAYRDLLAADPAAADQDTITYQGAAVYYNGRPTLAAKVALARREASGVMIWALPQDDPGPLSLLAAMATAVAAP